MEKKKKNIQNGGSYILAVDGGRESILSVWQWQWGHLLGKVAVSIWVNMRTRRGAFRSFLLRAHSFLVDWNAHMIAKFCHVYTLRQHNIHICSTRA